MRHKRHKHTLGVTPSHRKSMIQNLAIELIDHEKIKTTHVRCKAVKPFVEKLVTLAKSDSLANRRLALSKLNNPGAVKKLFATIGPRFNTRPGGYTRVIKLADGRVGDNAPVSYLSFVE